MDTWDGERVRVRLREMAEADPSRERFGADTHQYVLKPRLTEEEIHGFEEAHGIALPVSYRSFVARVGDGPAGPGHGLMPLTVPRPEADEQDPWAVDGEWEEDRLPGRLAEPFALKEPRTGSLGAELEEVTPGTLMLAEEGCGMFIRLILNGPHTGEVWRVDPDWAGFAPVSPDFRAWYTGWLTGR
ncbi:SMI1/KNR4 family protein [Streptomyces sp. NPDC001941]|uniref:SMI1/KNR4 family protein n=1 Tax=Streptomyces sp. NPDC001941 TaxID=3154659 RepID=UPI0033287686